MNDNRKKQGPTQKAPQNHPKAPQMTEEQQKRMMLVTEKGEAVMEILKGLTYAEAGMVIKTCDSMMQNTLNELVSTKKVGETDGQ